MRLFACSGCMLVMAVVAGCGGASKGDGGSGGARDGGADRSATGGANDAGKDTSGASGGSGGGAGGAAATGGAAGNATGGGAGGMAVGGTPGTAGAPASGGRGGVGGGTPNAGGSNSGGAGATGGSAHGGAASGGAANIGGAPGAGGTATGGAASGGAANTGGAPGTGGAATGGAASGGAPGTGGAPATAGWVYRTPCPVPSGAPTMAYGALAATAYDPTRARVTMLFDREHFEWDSATGTWLDRKPCTLAENVRPAPTTQSLVYDAARDRMVYIGNGGALGGSTVAVPNPIWEWSAATGWQDRTPAASASVPAGRFSSGFAYDAAGQRVLMFGGTVRPVNLPDVSMRELWSWNGTQWTNLTPATYPTGWPRAGRAILGTTGGTSNDIYAWSLTAGSDRILETWQWDRTANTWTARNANASNAPPDSFCCANLGSIAAQFDPMRGRFVIGAIATGPWEFDVTSGLWTRREQSPPANMVYDLGRQRMFWQVGEQTLESSDGVTYTDRTPPRTWPNPSNNQRLVYDSSRSQLLLIQSRPGNNRPITWIWSRAMARFQAVPFAASITEIPLQRFSEQGSFADDPTRSRVLMVSPDSNNAPAQLWQWTGATADWTNLGPSVLPERATASAWPVATDAAVGEIDAARQKLVFHGICGDGRNIPFTVTGCAGTWELDLAAMTWSARTPTSLPGTWPPDSGPGTSSGSGFPRGQVYAMVYDTYRAAVLLLRRSDGALWQWEGVAGTWTPLAGLPTAWNAAARIAYDKRHQRLVAIANSGGRWEWDSRTAAWMAVAPTTPTPSLVNWLTYDDTAQSLVSIGSWELWEWSAP